MAVAAESSNSLHIEQCPFNKPVLNNIFDVDLFSFINYPLTYRTRINNKIADIISLFLTSTFASLLLLTSITWVLLEIIGSLNKNRVICGTEMRL